MRSGQSQLAAILGSITLMLLGSNQVTAAGGTTTPEEVIRTSGEKMLSTVVERRAELETQPELIYRLVDDILLPHMDFETMSQLALGPSWREATVKQRKRFTEEFRNLLVRTYATAWLAYDDQTIEYLPTQPSSRPDRATVKVRLIERSGEKTLLSYALRLRDGAWKVYNLAIDGVSLLTNYRATFTTRVRSVGLDALIEELREMSAEAVSG